MAKAMKAIPEGYHSITPYLIVKGASDAIEFYKKAFNAVEVMRMPGEGGKIMHAEIKIGNSPIMLADEFPEMQALSPESIGGSPITLHIYLDNVDVVADQAIKAGAKVTKPLADQFYGDRTCGLLDPFGHQWYIATRIEDLTMEEINERFNKMKQ